MVTAENFYPRPPGGGRPQGARLPNCTVHISIHALRVEGDASWKITQMMSSKFLSTPSGWRATYLIYSTVFRQNISIHALRVEGDRRATIKCIRKKHFYPRPPGGGRPLKAIMLRRSIEKFLSTPSGWRATAQGFCFPPKPPNFYPRPPGGGRQIFVFTGTLEHDFYPRPPGGGRRLYEV